MLHCTSFLALAGLAFATLSPNLRAADAPSKIKVLLITGDDVDVHHWKETTAAVEKVLASAGKFDVKVSEDLKPFDSAEALAAYDVIYLNRFNRKAPLSDAAKKNLLDFVRGGKGFFVQHLASASFPDWDDFGKLCGRHWVMKKSGHGPKGEFAATIADKDHPVAAGLAGFKTDDELYAKLAGDEPIHLIVEAYSNWSKKTEPLVFSLAYGKGRVLHNAFGHDAKAIATPEVSTIIAQGVEWAATGKVVK